jgi:hypothetical protein
MAGLISLNSINEKCHPERSRSRTLRTTQSKDLHLHFLLYLPLLAFCLSSRRDLLLSLSLPLSFSNSQPKETVSNSQPKETVSS